MKQAWTLDINNRHKTWSI